MVANAHCVPQCALGTTCFKRSLSILKKLSFCRGLSVALSILPYYTHLTINFMDVGSMVSSESHWLDGTISSTNPQCLVYLNHDACGLCKMIFLGEKMHNLSFKILDLLPNNAHSCN